MGRIRIVLVFSTLVLAAACQSTGGTTSDFCAGSTGGQSKVYQGLCG